jgi:hypothetical protein
MKYNVKIKRAAKPEVKKPPGFIETMDAVTTENAVVVTAEAMVEAKKRQIMQIAWSPGRGIFQTCFMLWMSGTSIQIFSIMTTGMALFNPLRAIATTEETFKDFKSEDIGDMDIRVPKLLYVALQLACLGAALYQCSRMGLLPMTSADWTSFIPAKNILEQSGIPVL